jgi:serine/threonine protein kinase
LFEHPNLVKGKSFFKDELRNECHCVMTYVKGKEILDFISEMDQSSYSEKMAQNLCKQLFEGIKYLHSIGVCHRDIKPSNIMCTNDLQVVITDFNVAKARPRNEVTPVKEVDKE